MLWRDPRDIIGKTGWTRKAKHCFVGRVNYGRKTYYFAIMGSMSLWKDLKKLIDAFTGTITQYKRRTYHEKIWSREARKRIQRALKKGGFYRGAIDGKIGPQSQKAIVKFQKKQGIRADGMAGPSTYKRLKKYFK